jgi:predicted RNase H-like HicB family nuclease
MPRAASRDGSRSELDAALRRRDETRFRLAEGGDFAYSLNVKSLQRTIKAVIRQGDERGYVAECMEIAVVTQGATLDETVANLQAAVHLHLEGENLAEFGLAPNPTLLVTMELDPAYA